jgi:hypothetical protein
MILNAAEFGRVTAASAWCITLIFPRPWSHDVWNRTWVAVQRDRVPAALAVADGQLTNSMI